MQSNALEQAFNVASKGPVAIANDGSQTNDSDQDSLVPLGSLVIDPLRSTILK